MKVIIDIDENVFTRLFDNGMEDYEIAVDDVCEMARALRIGTPLDDVKAEIDQYLFQNEFGSEYRKEVSQILDNIGKAESEMQNADDRI